MKVAILLNWSINGDSRAQRIAMSLSKKYEVYIYCISSDDVKPSLLSNIKIIRVKEAPGTLIDRFILPFYSNQKNLYQAIIDSQIRFDIIYSHDLDTLPIGSKLKCLFDSKLVYDIHDLSIETLNQGFKKTGNFLIDLKNNLRLLILKNAFSFVENKYIRQADLIYTVNDSIASYITERYSGVACETVQNFPIAIELPKDKRLREELGISPNNFVVVYHGNLGRGRYLEELAQSSHYLSNNVKLVFIGSGILLPKLKELSNKNNTYFVNSLPYEKLFSYTSDANLGVVLLEHINFSKKYASANKMYEYMACGIPFIISNSPELVKATMDESFAIQINNITQQEIADQINKLTSKVEDMKMLGKRAREVFLMKMTWSTSESVLNSLFEKYIDDNNCRL